MTSYHNAHYRVKTTRGKASTYTCAHCQDAPAREWALDADPPHLEDPQGRKYSDDPWDYTALCSRCHQVYDNARGSKRGFAATPSTASREITAANAVKARAALAEMRTDPAEDARIRAAQSEGAKRGGCGIRRRCLDCGLETAAAPLGRHLKLSGHTGWEAA